MLKDGRTDGRKYENYIYPSISAWDIITDTYEYLLSFFYVFAQCPTKLAIFYAERDFFLQNWTHSTRKEHKMHDIVSSIIKSSAKEKRKNIHVT